MLFARIAGRKPQAGGRGGGVGLGLNEIKFIPEKHSTLEE